jgi:large subunit ribosomal protein LP2
MLWFICCLFKAFFNFTMKLIAAYLLAVLGGNTSPSADDIKNILESVGVEANDERLEFLLSELEGKDITEVIAAGREKFASVPSGGGGGIAVAAPTAAGGGAAPAEEAKKEEKVEEKEESDDVSIIHQALVPHVNLLLHAALELT